MTLTKGAKHDIVVIILFIDTNNISWNISTFSRCSDDNLLGSRLDVLSRTWTINEHTSSLYDNVNPHFSPGKLERVSAGHNLNKLPINRDRLVVNYLHVGFESSQHGIILQQVSCILDTCTVIHNNDIEW
nr:GapA [Ipomoea batatas]